MNDLEVQTYIHMMDWMGFFNHSVEIQESEAAQLLADLSSTGGSRNGQALRHHSTLPRNAKSSSPLSLSFFLLSTAPVGGGHVLRPFRPVIIYHDGHQERTSIQ